MSLAFVFPGQGSQSEGMLNALAADFNEVEATYAEASEVLGYDLWNIVQNGPAEKLNSTDITQPAMLAAGVAVWRVWQAKGGAQPGVLAGHSLGEYTALVCGGSLAFADAIKLVAERGRLMQQAVPAGTGAMAAVLGLDDDAVRQACRDAADGEVLEAVNFNSPGQVVVAGHKAAVERVVDLAKERGAKRALVLPVSVPSHCALMKPAAERLAVEMASVDFHAPRVPVLHNVTVAEAVDGEEIRRLLLDQLSNPVRWVETVEAIAGRGAEIVLEAGPGKVLTGLIKRIDKSLSALPVFDPASLDTALESINA